MNYEKSVVVLILVLMEDTLRGYLCFSLQYHCSVLILVLMEDTLRGVSEAEFMYHLKS